MKLVASFLLVGSILSAGLNSFSQENCKVYLSSIGEKYEGNCKKGKASGIGKAEGTDTYTGEFKDGLPHGKGLYIWQNGNSFEGNWASGKKNGQGVMTFKLLGKPDSTLSGFWKKDDYIGKYEKPYIIYSVSSNIVKNDIKFVATATNDIYIMVKNASGNLTTVRSDITEKAKLNDVAVFKGSYAKGMFQSESNSQTVYKLEGVKLPFRAKFRIGTQILDAEFLENGKYIVDIALNN